ncbi:MAG: thiamine-binding protein [Bacteroidota bacterium]
MKYPVHVAIQIVPLSKQDPYALIDKAIEVIQHSGVEFRVGAMETVMQGDYDQLMRVARNAQQACLDAGADEVVVTMKVHAHRHKPVNWEDKLAKYN